MTVRTLLGSVALVLLLTGCGARAASVAEDATPADRAARQLECSGQPAARGAGDYGDGLTEVQDDPTAALENWLDAEGWFATVPTDGYVVEWRHDGRALLSWDVDGRSKIAVVTADNVTDYNGDTGWGVETWAQCDPAEWPEQTTDELGVGIWTTAGGERQPTDRVVSYQGPEHCDWQDITFLHLGGERKGDEYLRDTTGELADYLTTTYDGAVALPAHARDTGWRRDGRELWLGEHPRAAYLVSLDDPADVERWPASQQDIGCA